ncbi:MAG: serine protease [Planctomycetaceae bacterium]
MPSSKTSYRIWSYCWMSLTLLVSAASAQAVPSRHFSALFQERALNAVLRITVFNGKDRGTCSGTVIGSEQNGFYVASAAHCFPATLDAIMLEQFEADHQRVAKKYDLAEILLLDDAGDFALLYVKGTWHGSMLPLSPGRDLPANGAPMLTVGCDEGSPPTCQVGRLIDADREQLVVREMGVPGRSGGPLISAAGTLLGCCCCGDGRQVWFSHPRRTNELLQRLGLSSLTRLSRSQVMPKRPQAAINRQGGANQSNQGHANASASVNELQEASNPLPTETRQKSSEIASPPASGCAQPDIVVSRDGRTIWIGSSIVIRQTNQETVITINGQQVP